MASVPQKHTSLGVALNESTVMKVEKIHTTFLALREIKCLSF